MQKFCDSEELLLRAKHTMCVSDCSSGMESFAVKNKEDAGRACILSLSAIRETLHTSCLAAAEFIGTFVVVLASCAGSMAAAEESAYSRYGAGHSSIAVGSGMAVMLMVWTLAPISAAHLNPAVTLGFAVARLISWQEVGVYILSQTTGALLASLSLQVIVHDPALFSTAINQPLHHSNSSMMMEFVATFILMLINMKVACGLGETGELAGSFMIGSTVALLGYYGRPLCGGLSMNPARSLGPALVAMNLKYMYPFIIGPIAGAMLSSLAYTGIKTTKNESIK